MSTPRDLPLALTGPAVWKGPQWRSRTDWIVRLDSSDVDEIEAAATAWPAQAHGLPHPGVASDFVLTNVGPRLAAIRDELRHGRGFSLLKGLPVKRWGRPASLLACLGLLGHLGRIEDGPLHDAAGPPAHCDAVGLFCLSAVRPIGPVRLCSVSALIQTLRIRQPEYADLPAEALAAVAPLSDKAQQVRASLDALAADPALHLPVRLDPGDLLCAHLGRVRVDNGGLDHDPAAADPGPLLRRYLTLARERATPGRVG